MADNVPLEAWGLQPYLKRWSIGLACYALAGGALSLLGWALDAPRLTDWLGNGISIQPNTCFAVMFAGAAALCLSTGRRRGAAILGAIVAVIGGSVLLAANTIFYGAYPSTFVNVIWAAIAIFTIATSK